MLQILIDLVMCWLVYQIGRKMFNERTGMIAFVIYACFVPGIELVVRPHRDIWVTFLFIFTVYQLIALRESKPVLECYPADILHQVDSCQQPAEVLLQILPRLIELSQ